MTTEFTLLVGAVGSGRRPASLIALHWLTLVLLLCAAGTVLAREVIDEPGRRAMLLTWHRQLGLWVFAACALRLLLRLKLGRLPPTGPVSRPERLASSAVHAVLYGLLVALPVLGWVATNSRGQAVTLLGWPLPSLVTERDLDLADSMIEWHQQAAWALLAVAGLHAVAALWHHFVRRDDVLRAMWPLAKLHRADRQITAFPRRSTKKETTR